MTKLPIALTSMTLCLSFILLSPGCATVSDAQVTSFVQRGEQYDVEIVRDPYGVPHIYGKRDVDCAYGLGFAHAEDDYVTIEKAMLLSRGLRARYFGADDAPLDYLVRLFRVRENVDAGYASLAPEALAACLAVTKPSGLFMAGCARAAAVLGQERVVEQHAPQRRPMIPEPCRLLRAAQRSGPLAGREGRGNHPTPPRPGRQTSIDVVVVVRWVRQLETTPPVLAGRCYDQHGDGGQQVPQA